jgi:hypothetical protein
MDTTPSAERDHAADGHDPSEAAMPSTGRRRRRRERRQVPLWVLVTCIVAVGLLAPSIAQAGLAPTFSDVPESHPFYDEIEWMARSGVSKGYNDGTYRPNDKVTRQEMSAFMQRLFDFQDDMSWRTGANAVVTSSTSYVDVPNATTTVVVPAGAWANISARFAGESIATGAADAWGSVRLMIQRDGGAFQELAPAVGSDAAFDSVGAGDADNWEAHAIERLGEGPGGTYVVKAQYRVFGSGNLALDDYTLVVETDLQPSSFVPS